MADVVDLFKSEIKSGLLFGSLLLDNSLDLNLGPLRNVTDDCGAGAADKIFREGIPPLREGEGHGHLAVPHGDGVNHPQLNDAFASFCGVDHLR